VRDSPAIAGVSERILPPFCHPEAANVRGLAGNSRKICQIEASLLG
jgi:hypothetical protein